MRTIVRMSSISIALSIVALGLAACQGSPAPLENVGEARLAMGAMQPNTVLIFDTAGDGAVYEATWAQQGGFNVEVVNALGWQAKTPADFATYEALIIGDMNCNTDPNQLLVAELTESSWRPQVSGNVIVVGTDPESHFTGALFTRDAIRFAAAGAGTGAYISLGCRYATALPGTSVGVLAGFGTFTVHGEPFYPVRTDAHQVATDPTMILVDDADLSWAGGAARSPFESFPATFIPHVILEDPTDPNALFFTDGSVGVPYVLSRGAVPSECGDGQIDTALGEICDDGNYEPGDGCSEHCLIDPMICGDGGLDQGEQCDDGNMTDGDGCSATCMVEFSEIGACCLSGGACAEALTPTDCQAVDGVYTASGLTCAQVEYECYAFLGACCLPEGICADDMTAATCKHKGGDYLGDNASCQDPDLVCKPLDLVGACCLDSGCAVMTQNACLAANGSFGGAGSVCDEATCPGCTSNDPIGACCVEGQCLMLSADACFLNGGLYAGDGSLCTSGTCDCGGPNGCCDELAAGCSMSVGDGERNAGVLVIAALGMAAAFGARRQRRR